MLIVRRKVGRGVGGVFEIFSVFSVDCRLGFPCFVKNCYGFYIIVVGKSVFFGQPIEGVFVPVGAIGEHGFRRVGKVLSLFGSQCGGTVEEGRRDQRATYIIGKAVRKTLSVAHPFAVRQFPENGGVVCADPVGAQRGEIQTFIIGGEIRIRSFFQREILIRRDRAGAAGGGEGEQNASRREDQRKGDGKGEKKNPFGFHCFFSFSSVFERTAI